MSSLYFLANESHLLLRCSDLTVNNDEITIKQMIMSINEQASTIFSGKNEIVTIPPATVAISVMFQLNLAIFP